jgi:tripartite-type tricarboxylate transporter receptor subunit TctC
MKPQFDPPFANLRENSMRTWLVVLLYSVSSLALAAEDSYPSRPVRMILPVAPSGGSDITARAIAPKLIEYLGQQVIIDNRPGGGGTVGMSLAARAAPDGYTFIQSSIGPTAVDQSLHSKMPYDTVKDFTPIARAVSALNILVVHPTLPVHSVKDMIDYAKKNPAKLNYGSSGLGHADHLAAELFNSMVGVKMQHIAYKGGAPAMTELLGNNIHLIFSTVSTAVSFIKAGRIRPIAVTSAKRVSLFPDIPTVAEGGLPGFEVDNWYCFLGPRDMPKPIVARLHRELNRALEQPDVKQRLEGFGIFPFLLPTPEAFGDYIKAEIKKYAKVVADAGIKAD